MTGYGNDPTTVEVSFTNREIYEFDRGGVTIELPGRIARQWRKAISEYQRVQEDIDRWFLAAGGMTDDPVAEA